MDKPLDLRTPLPPLEELMANGGRLLVTMILREMPYREYLKTNHWRTVREMVRKRSRGRCERLGCLDWMRDVHHNNYENIGCETDQDVEGLCGPHHKQWHATWKLAAHLEGRKQFRKD